MLFAMKNNRQIRIAEEDKQKYINLGYKIAKEVKGKLEFEELEAGESKELKELKAENKALKAELKALKEKGIGEGK